MTSTMTYRDTFSYRKGREQSQVVQTWLNSFKEDFMKKLKGNELGNLHCNMDEILLGSGHTAHIVTKAVSDWVISLDGAKFIKEAFDVKIPLEEIEPNRRRSLAAYYWTDERSSFMVNVIYRYDAENDVFPLEVRRIIHDGSPDTAEIVADTFIGWLNSPVGRDFVMQVYQITVPTTATDGSE